MEASGLIQALHTLRAQMDKPVSDLDIIRQSLQASIARNSGIEMPPLLTNEQRKLFIGKVDLVTAFLESEDGADAVELLIRAFTRFENTEIEKAPESVPVEAAVEHHIARPVEEHS